MALPRRTAAALGAASMLTAALAACGTSSTPGDPTASPTVTTSVSASPTKTAADQAADNAVAVWQGYLAAQDQLASDPSLPLTMLSDYASDPQLPEDQQSLQGFRTKGYVGGGARRVDSASTSLFSTVSDPSTTPPTFPSIHVTGCYDTTTVTLVDSTGASVQIPNRQTFFDYDATVSNADYPSTNDWRVTDLTVKPVESCNAAS